MYGKDMITEMVLKMFNIILLLNIIEKQFQKDNTESMYNLALLTEKGLGVIKYFKTAFTLLEKVANQSPTRKLLGIEQPNIGVAEAEHSLGLQYNEGIYVNKNYTLAAYWYKSAVDYGNGLVLFYMNGLGVDINFEKAEIFKYST